MDLRMTPGDPQKTLSAAFGRSMTVLTMVNSLLPAGAAVKLPAGAGLKTGIGDDALKEGRLYVALSLKSPLGFKGFARFRV